MEKHFIMIYYNISLSMEDKTKNKQKNIFIGIIKKKGKKEDEINNKKKLITEEKFRKIELSNINKIKKTVNNLHNEYEKLYKKYKINYNKDIKKNIDMNVNIIIDKYIIKQKELILLLNEDILNTLYKKTLEEIFILFDEKYYENIENTKKINNIINTLINNTI